MLSPSHFCPSLLLLHPWYMNNIASAVCFLGLMIPFTLSVSLLVSSFYEVCNSILSWLSWWFSSLYVIYGRNWLYYGEKWTKRVMEYNLYSANSIEKMRTNHAYSRAVREHFLTQLCLGKIILDELDLPETKINYF